jgi:bacteriocin biosynthesis cyclodehydratase domain-containing protein
VTARRPRLAPGFTVVRGPGVVWLVAGEDVRYRLGAADPAWLADLLARCDGRSTTADLAGSVAVAHRDDAAAVIARLLEERVLVDGTPAQAHVALPAAYRVTGTGVLADRLRTGERADAALEVYVQDRLDHAALLAHHTAALAAQRRWLWVTTGPGGRAYVSPLFVPGAGACAACLVLHFKRLSPVPELYDALIAHGAAGSAIAPSEFPDAAVDVTQAIARAKLALAAEPVAPSALYALHVVEVASLTVSSHEPIADPECTACRA